MGRVRRDQRRTKRKQRQAKRRKHNPDSSYDEDDDSYQHESILVTVQIRKRQRTSKELGCDDESKKRITKLATDITGDPPSSASCPVSADDNQKCKQENIEEANDVKERAEASSTTANLPSDSHSSSLSESQQEQAKPKLSKIERMRLKKKQQKERRKEKKAQRAAAAAADATSSSIAKKL